MGALEIAGVALGIIGRLTEGAADAIAAASARNEDEAFVILEKALDDSTHAVKGLRAKIAANKAEALASLAAKFPDDRGPASADPADDK